MNGSLLYRPDGSTTWFSCSHSKKTQGSMLIDNVETWIQSEKVSQIHSYQFDGSGPNVVVFRRAAFSNEVSRVYVWLDDCWRRA